MSSNWKKLQTKMGMNPIKKKKIAKLHTVSASAPKEIATTELDSLFPVDDKLRLFRQQNQSRLGQILIRDDSVLFDLNPLNVSETDFKKKIGSFLAMDCEFVGTGPSGTTSELARVSIVNYYGITIYDQYVLPTNRVTDFRTKYSGITSRHLKDAIPFKEAQQKVSDLLKNKTLVGHGIANDLRVLFLSHPRSLIIDTQVLQRFRQNQNIKGKPGLKKILDVYLGIGIQSGSHDSVEDAQSTMLIFRAFKSEFLQQNNRRNGGKTKAK